MEQVKSYIEDLSCEADVIANTMDLVLASTEGAICRGEVKTARKAVSALNLIGSQMRQHEEALSKLLEMLSDVEREAEERFNKEVV